MPRLHSGPRRPRPGDVSGKDSTGWQGRVRLWVVVDERNVLGPGKARILQAIDQTKSLSAAARRLGMSYRLAWKHLRLIGERTGTAVVEPRRGGRSGGGTDLTPEGRRLLEAYARFREEVERQVQDSFQRHFRRWLASK